MVAIAQIPGGGIVATSVKIGTVNPPTTVVTCQVTIIETQVESTFVAIPVTGCEAPADRYAGSKRKLRLQWLQDWGETDSLSEFLDDHDGESIFIEYIPLGGTAPKWVYEVQAVPGAEGGTMGQPSLADVTLPVIARTPTMPA